MRFTVDERPSLDWTPVASLPVRVFRLQGECGFHHEVQRGLIVKAHIDGTVFGGKKDFYKVYGLGLEFVEVIKGAPGVATDGCLAAPGLRKAQRSREAFASFAPDTTAPS